MDQSLLGSALLIVGLIIVGICFVAVPITTYEHSTGYQGDLTPLERFMLSGEGNVAFAFSWSTQALVLPFSKIKNAVVIGLQPYHTELWLHSFVARVSHGSSHVLSNRCS